MNLYLVLLCSLLGFAVSWLVIRVILGSRLASRKTHSQPTFHQTHELPVPRLGGLAFVAVFVVIAIIAFARVPVDPEQLKSRWVIVCSSLAMFFLGLWDDLRPLGARKKLLGQILIAGAACYFGIQMTVFRNPLTGVDHDIGAWGWVLTIFWLVALTNLINLVDGIDGLAGGVGLMLMGLLTYVGLGWDLVFPILCTAAMCGALLAFLRFNFPPAKIHMGDGGAYFLGYLTAVLSLLQSQKGTVMAALIAPAFVLALPIADTGLTILRRSLRGLPIFRPDRKHIHHRLLELGLSRRRALLLLYAICSVFLLMAFGVFWSQGRLMPILLGCAFLLLLVVAGMLTFSRSWFDVPGILERAMEARKETVYVQALGQWFELEADRADSIEALWSDFQFLVQKSDFARVKLTLPDGERTWESGGPAGAEPGLRAVHKLNVDGPVTLELAALPDQMSANVFEQLSEIMAEFWHKAALRWHQLNQLPVRFDSRLEAGHPRLAETRRNGRGKGKG